MSSNQKTWVFAIFMCVVCGFLLTFASTSLKPFQDRNIRLDKQKNVLKVLGMLDMSKTYVAEDLEVLYKENIKDAFVDDQGALYEEPGEGRLPIFLYLKDGQIDAYALPISGYGLWSTLYGYFSLKGDGATVQGITFYQHGETPGLGGEVEKAWFQEQFVGKQIVDAKGVLVSIGFVKGRVEDVVAADKQANYVDGISGATVTSKGVEVFLKRDLQAYEPFAKKLRSGVKVL